MGQGKSAIQTGQMGFQEFVRKEEDFVMTDEEVKYRPTGSRSAFRERLESKSKLLLYVFTSQLMASMWQSLVFCLLSGAIGSFFFLYIENVEANQEADPKTMQDTQEDVLSLVALVSDFRFLPVFLLGFFINKEAQRWTNWLGQT